MGANGADRQGWSGNRHPAKWKEKRGKKGDYRGILGVISKGIPFPPKPPFPLCTLFHMSLYKPHHKTIFIYLYEMTCT